MSLPVIPTILLPVILISLASSSFHHTQLARPNSGWIWHLSLPSIHLGCWVLVMKNLTTGQLGIDINAWLHLHMGSWHWLEVLQWKPASSLSHSVQECFKPAVFSDMKSWTPLLPPVSSFAASDLSFYLKRKPEPSEKELLQLSPNLQNHMYSYPSRLKAIATIVCTSYYEEVESTCPLFESGLVLCLPLTNRRW